MAFSSMHVSVSDYENEHFVQTDISDPSELKQLIDMNLSYKIDPEIKRQVTTDYAYEVNLVRDGCNLDVVYSSPTEIEIKSTSPKAELQAELSYKKKTRTMNVRKLSAAFNACELTEPPTDSEVADELAQLVALFRVAGEIAPLIFGEKLKVSLKTCNKFECWECDCPPDWPEAKTKSKRAAALRRIIKRQLADYDVLSKLQ